MDFNVAAGHVFLDGRRAHTVSPFTGELFSLVFYARGMAERASAETRATLAAVPGAIDLLEAPRF